jgi:hypothetical protein
MQLVTNDEVNRYMGTTGVDYAEDIARASEVAQGLIGKPVLEQEFTEYIDGGWPELFTKARPVKESSVSVIDTESNTTVDPITFGVIGSQGIIYTKGGAWGSGRRRWKVSFVAGIAPDVATVPADIKQAVLLLIKDGRTGGGTDILEEKIGDYSYKKADPSKVKSGVEKVADLLGRYKKVVF